MKQIFIERKRNYNTFKLLYSLRSERVESVPSDIKYPSLQKVFGAEGTVKLPRRDARDGNPRDGLFRIDSCQFCQLAQSDRMAFPRVIVIATRRR